MTRAARGIGIVPGQSGTHPGNSASKTCKVNFIVAAAATVAVATVVVVVVVATATVAVAAATVVVVVVVAGGSGGGGTGSCVVFNHLRERYRQSSVRRDVSIYTYLINRVNILYLLLIMRVLMGCIDRVC